MQPSRWFAVPAFAAAPLFAAFALPAFRSSVIAGSMLTALMVMAIVAGFAIRRRATKERQADYQVDNAGVHIAGEQVVDRRRIVNAQFVPRTSRKPDFVRLDDRDRYRTELEVADQDEGAAILATLGYAPTHHAFVQRCIAPYSGPFGRFSLALFAVAGLGLALALLLSAPAFLFVIPFAILAQVVMAFATKVEVGAEGLRLFSPVTQQFFSYDEVAAVGPSTRGVRVALRKGSVEIPLTPSITLAHEHERVRQAELIARMRAALEAYRGADPTALTGRLQRRGRNAEQWSAALKELGRDYRQAAITDEALLAVAQSPAAEPSARGGAAALLADSNNEVKQRLRVAAEACASPKLRVVLDRAATGDADATLELAAELEETENDLDAADTTSSS